MKKMIYNLSRLVLTCCVAAALVACTEETGSEPGNDPSPKVTVYQYPAPRPDNPDNDIVVRFAANRQTESAYYLVEKTSDAESRATSLGEEGYMDYVVSNGEKINGISGVSNADVTIRDLYGAYTVTAVAVGGTARTASRTSFTGLEWSNVTKGTYYFEAVPNLKLPPASIVLQVCTTDKSLYRFKDVFGPGYSLKINILDLTGSDENGEYRYFRVPVTETPITYGDHGAVGVRDIGYWQGSDAWVTENGYESGMYSNYDCFIYVQYFVSAGNLGYNYDRFVAE